MKKISIVVTACFIFLTVKYLPVSGQINKASFSPFTVELRKQFYKNTVSGKHFFEYTDERDDITRMGYFYSDKKIFYFTFPEAAAGYLSSKFNSGNTSTDTVEIKVRRLWLSQEKISASFVKSFMLSAVTTKGACRLICNVYKKNANGSVLLYSYDSTITKNGYLGNTNDELIGNSVKIMMHTVDSMADLPASNTASISAAGKKITPRILTDGKINEGIYRTYADFLDNRPDDIPFEFKQTKKLQKIQLAVSKTDDSVYTDLSWGFCKDGVPYVRIGDGFSELRRQNNSFDLFVTEPINAKYISHSGAFWGGVSIAAGDGLAAGALYAVTNAMLPGDFTFFGARPVMLYTGVYKLDIATGEIY